MLGASKGLCYLHMENPPVVHHDVNAYVAFCALAIILFFPVIFRSNILLDEHFTAKISDFGFSIQVPESYGKKTLITVGPGLGLPGTPGYRPPEFSDGHYSTKSDVYSYGVVSCFINP